MIVAAHAGTGKTYLAEMYPDKVIDFVCMPYKYLLSADKKDHEVCKAEPNLIMRPEWPDNYAAELISMRDSEEIILIPPVIPVLQMLNIEEIPYFLVYPQREAKEAYLRRYIDRGNSETFLDIFIQGWDLFLVGMETHTGGQHIVLKPHEFLSDALAVFPLDQHG
ncbi:MAG TPA: hypothetical protein DDY59_06710 [Lachnospiraceae bacterium]|jgi:hypothetical protein|nr:hypothetical protein [Lachnospiraceae bacterium]